MFSDDTAEYSESLSDGDIVYLHGDTPGEGLVLGLEHGLDLAPDTASEPEVQPGRCPPLGSGDDDDDDSRLTNDNEIYMSVMWSSGHIGIAYYRTDTTEMYLMPDTVETENFDILLKVFHQVQPYCIIVRTKEYEQLSRCLKGTIEEIGKSIDGVMQMQPCSDFSLDSCKRRILLLRLPNIPETFTEAERSLCLSSLISFDSVNMVRAAGALLKFLEKNRVGIELEDVSTRIPVLAIRTFTLEDLVQIDENSYRALQIFKTDSHPSGFKIEAGREGMSLFGILNKCKSKAGSQLLRMWFMHPLRNLRTLNDRLDAVSFFADRRNLELTLSLQNCIKNIRPLAMILRRMMAAQCSIRDWQSLYKTVYNAICVGDLCASVQNAGIAIFQKIVGTLTNEALHRIAHLISKIVDMENSIILNRFVVKPKFDSALDEKKKLYNNLPEFMTRNAQEEIKNLDEDIEEIKVIYLPQLGYILTVPLLERMKQTENYEINGLEFMFVSDGFLHYKSAGTRNLDESLGDIQCDIMDMETEIMHQLQNGILEKTDLLLKITDDTAELDCLLCLAYCSQTYNYVRPLLTESSKIEIRCGRHPIVELCSNPFVANDTLSEGQEGIGKMKILSGTNASGKTVYFKQVGLIVFMSHIGSFVPAESAVIGITDKIFTRIQTVESVSIRLSSFTIDLNQMSIAVQQATERSLVIIDEFGKGTDPVDGLALLCACLRYWLSRANGCPHVFVSTHFHNLQRYLTTEAMQPKYQMMEVMVENGELIYLYQLVEGVATTSCALNTAAVAGIPQSILQRAVEVYELNLKDLPISGIDQPSTQLEYKRCNKIVSKFMSLDLDSDDLEDFLQNFVLPVSQGKTIVG